MEKEPSMAETKKCVVCKCTGEGKVLLSGVQDEKQVWVCTRCLPMLIHGAH